MAKASNAFLRRFYDLRRVIKLFKFHSWEIKHWIQKRYLSYLTDQTNLGFRIRVWDFDGEGTFATEDDLVDVYEGEIRLSPNSFKTTYPRYKNKRFNGAVSSMGVQFG